MIAFEVYLDRAPELVEFCTWARTEYSEYGSHTMKMILNRQAKWWRH